VTNRDLTATNNGSERAAPCAVYRKITNGFRSEWGAALYADIRSVVETARRRSVAQSTQSASPSKACRSKRRLTNTRGREQLPFYAA